MAQKQALDLCALPTTFDRPQRTGLDVIGFADGIDYQSQPRILIVVMRLFSFGFGAWVQSGTCSLPDTIKKIIYTYQTALKNGIAPVHHELRYRYNRAGLRMLHYYADYQHWLYDLDESHDLYAVPVFEKYRLLSAPLKLCPYITAHSAARMIAAGIYSLHQMLLTLTYPQMRMLGYMSRKDAARLFPRLQRLGVYPHVDAGEILITADEMFDAIYELNLRTR